VAHRIPSAHAGQVRALRRQFAQAPGLPFADVLPPAQVEHALREEKVTYRDRLFAPLVTLWVFLSQVLDPDHSCRQAVARLLAYRAAQSLPACSSDTGAYCKARRRLPEGLLARLTRSTGRQLQDEAPPGWRWRGRTVKVVDGTTVRMPDTPANRRDFPAPQGNRWRGAGFPVARLAALFSLTAGVALDVALGPFQGKQTGETALFRSLHHHLGLGDVLLADRYYCSYFEIALLAARGAAAVFRLHQRRPVDFRQGRRLGPDDRVVVWTKPKRPAWLDQAAYDGLPETLTVRQVRVRVGQVGFRTRSLVVATTLLDPEAAPRPELAGLYRLRWHAELDLRSLKAVMQMGVLRCQSPPMVRKEVWAHLLAYNLIRALMAQVAREQEASPLEISFKATLQTLNAFAPLLLTAKAKEAASLCRRLREMIAEHHVGDRPDRYEPRAKRRRANPNPPPLNEPRAKARARLARKR
jgi:hypothetical protein